MQANKGFVIPVVLIVLLLFLAGFLMFSGQVAESPIINVAKDNTSNINTSTTSISKPSEPEVDVETETSTSSGSNDTSSTSSETSSDLE